MREVLAIANADIQNGKLILNDKDKFNRLINKYKNQSVYVIIEKALPKKTDPQNKYYWGVVVEHEVKAFEDATGDVYTKEDLHEFNKSKFFCKEILIEDEVLKIPLSTKDFDIKEFSDKLAEIRKWFQTTLNYTIPEPNEIMS